MLRKAALLVFLGIFAQPSFAQTAIPDDSRLKTVTDKKIVRIAYRRDASPFSFERDKDTAAGYTVDLCRQVVEAIGRQFGQRLEIHWVPVTLQTRLSAIANNQADMECGSTTVTLRRMEEVDFSSFVFIESTAILIQRQSKIRSALDLKGKKVAVVAGTTNERAITDHIRRHKLDAVTLVVVEKREDGIAALESGAVDGFAGDKLLLIGVGKQRPDTLALLPDEISVEPYAIALPRGDWAFRLAVNRALAQIYNSDAQYELFVRWFGPIGLRPSELLGAAWTFGDLEE